MPELPEQPITAPETTTTQVSGPEPSFESHISSGQPAPATQPAGFRDYFSKAGYDTSGFKDDESLVQATLSTLEKYRQNEPLVDYGKVYQQHAGEFQQWMSDRQKPAPEPVKPAQSEPKWKSPEYDPSWERFVEVDERSGRYKPLAPELAQYASKLNAYADWRRDAGQKLIANPLDTLREAGLEDYVQQQIEARIAHALQAQQQQWSVNEIIDRHSQWAHQHDGKGNLIWNAATQRPALTPAGEQYARTVAALEQAGVADPRLQDQFATTILAGVFAAEQPPAPAAPAEPVPDPATQQKSRFLDRARQSANPPSRNGAQLPSTNPRFTINPDASFLDLAMQEAREKGLVPATG